MSANFPQTPITLVRAGASLRRIWPRTLAGGFVALAALSAVAGDADSRAAKPAPEISLEDLINIRVTSVSKKETRLEDSPAAVAVITQDDLRRLGISSLPEALRWVPGMD